ncbi:MAG: Mur ligase family protein [Bacteroidales bacterium]
MSNQPNSVVSNEFLQNPLLIEEIKAIHGAGYYSAGPVIIMQLNLGEWDEIPTNTINGFFEKLQQTIPGLQEHHCSEGEEGGFFTRVKDGTLLGHVAEHIALELQNMAGMNVGFGKTRSAGRKGVYNVIFRFINETAGKYAARASVDIINRILTKKEINIDQYVGDLTWLQQQHAMDQATKAITDEAYQRNIPVIQLDSCKLIQLGTGKYQKHIRGNITSDTTWLAGENSLDPYMNLLMLANAGISVPRTIKTEFLDDVLKFWKSLRKPVTIKATAKNGHSCIFPAINNSGVLEDAFTLCKNQSNEVIVSEQTPGLTYRLLIINHKFVAATLLESPELIGNGKENIAVLIQKLNDEQERRNLPDSSLKALQPDDKMLELLSYYGYTLNDIPEKGTKVPLVHNTFTAGIALSTDVTGVVHPVNRYIAERAAEVINLPVAGVDIICPDISKPIEENQGTVVNVEMDPDLQMHMNPWKGQPRDIAAPFLDSVFPEKSPTRIPVISVTGSAGKSVCTYLINFMLEKEGYKTGLAHSDGIFIDGRRIIREDMANFDAAQLILKDSGIDCAVFETPAESIMSHGLGYDFADVGIVLNVHPQHLNISNITTIENLAYAKSVVAEEVYRDGFSVLNADDPLVMEMKERLYSKPVLFTSNTENPEFRKHCLHGGMGAGTENNEIYLWTTGGKHRIATLNEIPLWANGKNDILLEPILAAICALAAFDVKPDKISHLLKAFKPASSSLHGRLMTFYPNQNTVIIDKPAGPVAIKHLREKIMNQNSVPEIFIDLSGNIPEDFWKHFFEVFRNDKIKVELFFSNIDPEDVGHDPSSHENLQIIKSLQERYKKSVQFHPRMSEQEIISKITGKATKSQVKANVMNYHNDAVQCIKILEKKEEPSVSLIISWNYKYLQQLISHNLIIV